MILKVMTNILKFVCYSYIKVILYEITTSTLKYTCATHSCTGECIALYASDIKGTTLTLFTALVYRGRCT
jgi:hypothetical protein